MAISDLKDRVNDLSVPNVGLPMTVGDATLVASLLCKCRPTNAPLVVIAGGGVVCPFCRNAYVLVEGKWAMGMKGVRASVQHVGKADVTDAGQDGLADRLTGHGGNGKPS